MYLLAAEHRWQWDEWCDANGVGRDRIGEAKALALDGLLAASARSEAARNGRAFLVDQQYGAATLARALGAGVATGTPAEKPGVFPLEWTDHPFTRPLTGSFAKVLIRYRPEWSDEAKGAQMRKLRDLAGWCRGQRKPLVLEVIIPRQDEPEDMFEAEGRPALLADIIARCYEGGVAPDFWKIEGTTSAPAMQVIDRAIASQPSSKLLILGKGAGFDLINAWFRAAAGARTAAGFAIGRSVYWQPAVEFLLGQSDRTAAVDAIAVNYLRVIASWQAWVGGAAAAPGTPAR
jgi:5-dehydro-2-deoxygluconokinase